MSSYYEGQRRYALGGKGWTIVMGTMMSLTYVRLRAKMQHDDRSQAHHNLVDERGKPVLFHDQAKAPNDKEDIVLRIWRQLPQAPLPNLYIAAGGLTAFWAYRTSQTFEKLMIIRYSDVYYQLKRPDFIQTKLVAIKYLALPLAVLPAAALLGFGGLVLAERAAAASQVAAEDSADTNPQIAEQQGSALERQASALRETLLEPVRQAALFLREVFAPIQEDLAESPLAVFAQRSQQVGKPFSMTPMPGVDTVVPPASGGGGFWK